MVSIKLTKKMKIYFYLVRNKITFSTTDNRVTVEHMFSKDRIKSILHCRISLNKLNRMSNNRGILSQEI